MFRGGIMKKFIFLLLTTFFLLSHYIHAEVNTVFQIKSGSYNNRDVAFNNYNQEYFAVWSEYIDTGTRILGARISKDGNVIDNDIIIATCDIDDPSPAIAYAGADSTSNRYLIVWKDCAYCIRGQFVNHNGTFSGEKFNIDIYFPYQRVYYPDVGSYSNGVFLVAFEVYDNVATIWGREIYGKIVNENRSVGNRLQIASRINSNEELPKVSQVDKNFTNCQMVVWGRNGEYIQATSVFADESIGTEFEVTPSGGNREKFADVSGDCNKALTVFESIEQNNDSAIKAIFISNQGVIDNIFDIRTSNTSTIPKIGKWIFSEGTFITWHEDDESGHNIYGVRISETGDIGNVIQLSNTAGTNWSNATASDSINDRFMTTWDRGLQQPGIFGYVNIKLSEVTFYHHNNGMKISWRPNSGGGIIGWNLYRIAEGLRRGHKKLNNTLIIGDNACSFLDQMIKKEKMYIYNIEAVMNNGKRAVYGKWMTKY